jgi:uncharacterized protein
MGDVSNEPSMEEILSSIKRIIAEDSEASLSPPRHRRAAVVQPVADPLPEPDEEVLELTETVAPDVAVEEVPPVQASASVAETKPALVSPAAAEASRSSLAALSALIVKPEVVGSDTLEGLVREMLKPMVAEWLEARLPDVVERMVAQEIKRITARD